MNRFWLGMFSLFITSPVDFPLMLAGGELLPHRPAPVDLERPGNWYHHAKAVWTVLARVDAEWWVKLYRFLIWWLIFAWVIK